MISDEYEDEVEPERSWYDDTGMDRDSDSPSAEDLETRNALIQNECLEKFNSQDFIMEPEIFSQLKRYFQSGGNPEQVIELLSENYHAIAQTANLLAEWLIMAGMKISDVQKLVEDHLQSVIVRHFDPKKADMIFTEEGETPPWLTEMIEHQTWRSLIYKLAEDYPDCLMLNFTIKLISDAGYQNEITSISTASQQLEVYSRILKTYVQKFLEGGEEELQKNLKTITRMVCHGEHTYLYSQTLLHLVSQEPRGGSNIKRLSQEICAYLQGTEHNAAPITMALIGAAAVPRVYQALSAMLCKNALNPADITVLYQMYQASEPPSVELIRIPQFLDLLMDSLFKPGMKINPEHKHKYIFLLAYAASVYESYKKGMRKLVSKEELKTTITMIEKAHTICMEKKGSSELIPELNSLYQYIRFPVVALGIIKWVDYTVSEASYFKLCTEHTPLHLALLDEIAVWNPPLHPKIMDLLVRLFEMPQEDLDVLVRLEVKKMLIDRMVHLLSRGCIVLVVNYIKQCFRQQDTDISLIRYFVAEVLDIIAPPYTSEFVDLFLPLVKENEITDIMRTDANDPVSTFLKAVKPI